MSRNLEIFKRNGYLVKENLIDQSFIRKINKIVSEVISKEKKKKHKVNGTQSYNNYHFVYNSSNSKNKEIDTIIHYPIPPHKQKAYSSDYKTFDLRIAEEMSTQLLSLPIGPHLTIEQVDFVIKTIKDFLVRV